MPSKQQPTSMSWSQVAAFRLSRHHLLQRAAPEELLSVVSDMVGAQAQLLSAACLSLAARIGALQMSHIEDALRERKLVKAACMRRTLFLLPAEQLALFIRGSAGRAEKELRWARGKGVPERTIDAVIDATLQVLEQPCTRSEIAQRVCKALGVEMQAVHGGGWGSRREVAAVPVGHLSYPVVSLLHMVAARGVVCYAHEQGQGQEPRFVRADAWIPHWHDLDREEAEQLLLRRYLRAFGPASLADFAMWAGLNLTDARRIWSGEQAALAAVSVGDWEAAVLREDLPALQHSSFEGPVLRLLPYFDSYLLGHTTRDHLVATQHRPQIYRPQGWIAPVVLIDGRAHALWSHRRQGEQLHITVAAFEPVSHLMRDKIQEEAQNLGRFLELPRVDVQIDDSRTKAPARSEI